MKDDMFKKLQNILSGSASVSKEVEISETDDKDSQETLNNFLNQILDVAWVEDDLKKTVAPSYYLSKNENSYWLLNTQSKVLMNIKSGVEIIPIENGEKETLCMIGYGIFSIPNKLLVCAGWN